MSDADKLALAEQFVRKAVSHLSSPVNEAEIKRAAQKAAKGLPPYAIPKEEEACAA